MIVGLTWKSNRMARPIRREAETPPNCALGRVRGTRPPAGEASSTWGNLLGGTQVRVL